MGTELANGEPIIAILGCGRARGGKEGFAIGHAHAEGWLKAAPRARLCGVDISPENLSAFGERFGLPADQLFASTDALYAAVKPVFVSVCTWPALHRPMVLEAVARGARGIVCEKPMALDVGEMRQMRAAAAAAGVRLAIAHQRRYEPSFQLARELLRGGAIGDSWVLEARVNDDWDILSWTVHWFDMANYLFGATATSVLAGGDVTGQRRYQHAVENASLIFAEYDGGRQAVFVTGPAGHGITVRGSRGMLQITDGGVKVWNEGGFTLHRTDHTDFPGGFARLMSDMLNGSWDEPGSATPPTLCDVSACFAATEMAYAAHESMRTARRVALPFDVEYAPLEVMAHAPNPAFPFKNVVLMADEHFGSGGREGLAGALGALAGNPPALVEASSGLAEGDVDAADLLVLYHTHAAPDQATRNTLTSWVTAGRPLLIVHAALGAYPDWQAYRGWCGRVWAWGRSEHPHEAAELSVQNAALATGWKRAWLPRDEVFIKLDQTDAVEDLLAVRIGAGVFPGAWRSKQFPNIGVWVPGHRRDLWSLPVMRQGLAALVSNLAADRRAR